MPPPDLSAVMFASILRPGKGLLSGRKFPMLAMPDNEEESEMHVNSFEN